MQQIANLTKCSLGFFLYRPGAATNGESVESSLPLVESLLSGANPTAAAEFMDRHLESLPEERRGDLLLRLANALAMEGSYQEAIDWCLRARNIFENKRDLNSVGRCHQTLGFCYTNVGPLKRAHICFLDAESRLQPSSKWKAKVALAVVAERRGDFDGGLKILKEVEGIDDPSARLYASGVRANIMGNLGQWSKVLEIELDSLGLAEELGAKDQIGERLVSIAQASIYTRAADVGCKVAQATGFFQSQTDAARKAMFQTVQSLYFLHQGDLAKATTYADAALEAAIRGHYRRAELASYLRLTEIALKESRNADALAQALKAAAYAESYEYACEGDYAESIAALLLAQKKDMGHAARQLSALDARRSWKSTSPTKEIVAATRALMAGESSSIQDLVDSVHASGMAFMPGFEDSDRI